MSRISAIVSVLTSMREKTISLRTGTPILVAARRGSYANQSRRARGHARARDRWYFPPVLQVAPDFRPIPIDLVLEKDVVRPVAGRRHDGRLRVSARHLDETLSTGDVPAHAFDRGERLSAGEIVDIEIVLLPIGLTFDAGEQLCFIVGSSNLLGTLMLAIREYQGANSGQQVIHTDGENPFYLQLPVQNT